MSLKNYLIICLFAWLCLTSAFISMSSAQAIVGRGGAENVQVGSDEGAGWKALEALDKQVGDTAKTDPGKAVQQYETFFRNNPKLGPTLACFISSKIAELYRTGLKNPEKAQQIYDWGLQKYPNDPAVIFELQGRAHAFLDEKHPAEVEKFVTEHWAQIIRAGQTRNLFFLMMVSFTLNDYSTALEQENKTADIIKGLETACIQIPLFWDESRQSIGGWETGWMYQKLVTKLIEMKHPEEALQWAKLDFMACDFDKDAIGRATKLLNQAWLSNDDFAEGRLFAAAQEDSSKPNPLLAAKIPALDEAILQGQAKSLWETNPQPGDRSKVGDRGKVVDLITILIVARAFGAAMNQARRLLADDPAAPEGSQQVCRIFKAADLNPARANAFISYLSGEGPNPLPQFFKDYPVDAAATP